MPRAADKEDWSGIVFANGWMILEKFNCAEYKKIYEENTGDTTKQIKNSHYSCINNNCGVFTYMERTTIKRAIDNKTPVMKLCAGCKNNSLFGTEQCHYGTICRNKPLYKTPERNKKVEIGKIYGNFKVLDILPSGNYSDHQCRAKVKCIHCGTEQERRFDALLNCQIACDCFRPHSSGETIIKFYLEDYHIPYKAEYTFNDLYSPQTGKMRSDFAIIKNDNPIALIEFDGQQHFEEAGSYYNPTGKVQSHDALKNDYARQHNIPLIRIPYTEILNIYKILDQTLKPILTN